MVQDEFDAFVAAACDVPAIDPDAPLADQGVDSLATLTLLIAVEERFGVEIDLDVLGSGLLSTSSALRAYVENASAPTVSA